MRIVVNLADAAIVQVEKNPDVGTTRAYNGKYALPIPDNVALDVTGADYVLPVDGGDVTSKAMLELLAQFPMYSNIVFNPLLTAADMADLDLTATFTPTGDITRAMVGRGSGPLTTGCSPNTVCVLPQNNGVAPAHPGVLISDTIDISAATGGLGADDFMVWWHLYDVTSTEDVTSSYGATNGLNDPAYRNLAEQEDQPTGFEVWLSHDDGATYTQMDPLNPTDFGSLGTLLRIAFINTSNSRRYVASYAILF